MGMGVLALTEVTLAQMLEARERRARCQKKLLDRLGLPVVSFTLNIPGPVKRSPPIQRAYRYGLELLRQRFRPRYVSEYILDTGCEALLAVEGEPAALKRLAVAIEDADPLGRLLDIDVLDPAGAPVSRQALGLPERTCLLCGGPAHACARSRAHGVEALFGRAMDIIARHFAQAWVQTVAQQAQRALLWEVAVTPKPGLVDRQDSGAHQDMDIFTFLDSAAALAPYLGQCAQLGMDSANQTPSQLYGALEEPARRAEGAMYRATGGVNTHKGAIYSMGLACAAAGRLYGQGKPFSPWAVLSLCGQMARQAVDAHFAALTWQSACTTGEKLFLRHGLQGVRGQAASGFPAVREVGLPILRMALSQGRSLNDAACATLMHFIARVPDTVLIGRSSYPAWQRLSQALQAALDADPLPQRDALVQLNQAFIQENLSPGGCADLLALTLFLHFMDGVPSRLP